MTRRPTKEELKLWNAVARTVSPNHGAPDPTPSKNLHDLREEMAALMRGDAHHPQPSQQKPERLAKKPVHPSRKPDMVAQKSFGKLSKQPFRPNALDERAFKDIRKGRLPIDGRLDLHGLTQAEAHSALDTYIASARASGRRHVLVITGKGRGNDGVLKRVVPIWLSMPPLSFHVNGVREAHGEHGGSGALYVRLRRPA